MTTLTGAVHSCFQKGKHTCSYVTVAQVTVMCLYWTALLGFWYPLQQQGLFKTTQSKSPFKLSTAEKKLLIVFCYYILLGAFALHTFVLSTRNAKRRVDKFSDHFKCEASGSGADCSKSELVTFTFPWHSIISNMLFGLFPAVNLIFVTNIQELKQFYRHAVHYYFASQTQTSSS